MRRYDCAVEIDRDRNSDEWRAVHYGASTDCPTGRGETHAEALRDLAEQLGDEGREERISQESKYDIGDELIEREEVLLDGIEPSKIEIVDIEDAGGTIVYRVEEEWDGRTFERRYAEDGLDWGFEVVDEDEWAGAEMDAEELAQALRRGYHQNTHPVLVGHRDDAEEGDHTYPVSVDVADVYFCHECSKEFFSEYVDRPECCPFCGGERVASGGAIELGNWRHF